MIALIPKLDAKTLDLAREVQGVKRATWIKRE